MILQKLKQQKGETLIETMMSLMIALMCMSILTISVTTASKMNMETNRLDEKYSLDLQMAEQHLAGDGYDVNTAGNVKIDFTDESGIADKDVQVTVYGGDKEDNAFASYTR